MAWDNTTVTKQGILLLQRVLGGETLVIDKAEGGSGTVGASELSDQVALQNKKQNFSIVEVISADTGKKINILITNIGLTEEYQMQQLGIYAHIDSEPPVLFAILQDDVGIKISSQTQLPDFTLNFFATIQFSHEANFQLTVDTSAIANAGMVAKAKTDAIAVSKDYVDGKIGKVNGIASLGSNGKVPTSQLPPMASTASQITYNNTTSGLTATNVQAALDEVQAAIYKPTLKVNVATGSTLRCVNGSTTLTATVTGDHVIFKLPRFGVWALTATKGGETSNETVEATEIKLYEVDMHYSKVYGIEWDYSKESSDCKRLGLATGLSDPSPAIGTGVGSSPFDSIYPWSEMEEYNIINGQVSYKKGQPGFSRSNDTVVKIPKFYIKHEKDIVQNKMRLFIADKPTTGFVLHPAFDRGDGKVRDAIYVGKYNTGDGYVSKTGVAILANKKRSEHRIGSAAKGAQWWQYDIATALAIQALYAVEFSNWNSQAKIGKGYIEGNSNPRTVGETDAMSYHTGRAAGTDGKTSVQYRGIENLWGNCYEFVDGINVKGLEVFICLNPSLFADDTAQNYKKLGYTLAPNSGYISEFGLDPQNPAVFLPNKTGGSDSTKVPDYVYVDSAGNWYIAYFGGGYSNGSDGGLFCEYLGSTSTATYSNFGGRLLYLP